MMKYMYVGLVICGLLLSGCSNKDKDIHFGPKPKDNKEDAIHFGPKPHSEAANLQSQAEKS